MRARGPSAGPSIAIDRDCRLAGALMFTSTGVRPMHTRRAAMAPRFCTRGRWSAGGPGLLRRRLHGGHRLPLPHERCERARAHRALTRARRAHAAYA